MNDLVSPPAPARPAPKPAIKIRPATIDDVAPIFHLGEIVFTPESVTNLYRTWDEFEVTSLYNSEPEHMLVAIAGRKRVVGFALGATINKKRSAWSYGHLLWLAVDPALSRMGIAGMLFDRFRRVMEKEGVRMLLVDTQADNEAATRFFSAKGFVNPVDHVYMTLNLESTS